MKETANRGKGKTLLISAGIEIGVPASGRVLAEAGFKKLGIRQWVVLAVFVVFSAGGQLIPKMAVGEQRSPGTCCLWELCR